MVCYDVHVLRRLEFYAIYRCGLRLNLVEERDCGWTGGGAVRVLADNPELCVDGRSVFELGPE